MRESLLRLPYFEAALLVFLAACAIGGLCILISIAVRSLPDLIRDVRAWRAIRKALID
jgi:hypothetical protein